MDLKSIMRGKSITELGYKQSASISFLEDEELVLTIQGKSLKIIHASEDMVSDYIILDPESYDYEEKIGYKPFSEGSKIFVGAKVNDLPFKLDLDQKEPIYFSISASKGKVIVKNHSKSKIRLEVK